MTGGLAEAGERGGSRVCGVCHFECLGFDLERCPSCGTLFDAVAEAEAGDDVTPYAQAETRDRAAGRAMRRWVYSAGSARIGHVALMCRSVSSRRFSGRSVLLLAVAGAVLQLATVGWHVVVRTSDNALILQTKPVGGGWVEVVRADASPVTLGMLSVWWHPVQGGIGFTVGLVMAWLVGMVVTGVLHGGAMGRGGRMEAAVDYGLAWTRAIFYAGLVTLLWPLSDVLRVWGYGFFPGRGAVVVILGVVTGVSVLLYWFWLVRSAASVPNSARGWMVWYYVGVGPVLVAGVVSAWWIGLDRLFGYLWQGLGLQWQQV